MVPFTDILGQIRKGAAVTEASEQLAEVVRACLVTGKAGEVTLKLKITPEKGVAGRNSISSAQFEVEAAVSSKAPKLPIPKGIFFGNVEGDLLRDDPDQRPIFGDVADREMRGAG